MKLDKIPLGSAVIVEWLDAFHDTSEAERFGEFDPAQPRRAVVQTLGWWAGSARGWIVITWDRFPTADAQDAQARATHRIRVRDIVRIVGVRRGKVWYASKQEVE